MLEEGQLNQESQETDKELTQLVLTHLDPSYLKESLIAQKGLKNTLADIYGTEAYLDLVQKFEVSSENPRLLEMAINENDNNLGKTAATLLLRLDGEKLILNELYSGQDNRIHPVLMAIRGIGNSTSIAIIEEITFDNELPLNVRKEAASAIGGSYGGEDRVRELLKGDKLPENLIASAVTGVSRAWRKNVRTEATSYLDNTGSEGSALPPMEELLSMEGNAEKGLTVFKNNCAVCHQVDNIGMDFGPKLTEIGSKLSREAQFISIIHPDAGISFGYEGYLINMKDGSTMGGIITSETETDIDLKLPGGSSVSIKTSDMSTKQQMDSSMMPSGLEKSMSHQELVDLVAYLMTLKKQG
jgi:putative heme-binding domain-containing protein